MTSFYSQEELTSLGLAEYGENVLISRKASIYSPEKMHLGSNVRVDDFCILSGRITMGSYIHVGAGTTLFGGDAGITFDDYSTVSSRCGVFAHSDDLASGLVMTNPMVPEEYRSLIEKPVYIGKHVAVAAGCTILPGVKIGEGSILGAMTLADRDIEPWGVYYGIPAKRHKERGRELLDVCRRFEEDRDKK
ncbi:MAG: acyltransferase [Candidatus Limivicinus sp.]|jgi:acetyltransferase-like isoleucine patch superfamily enzyme